MLRNNRYILGEGAVIERVRREFAFPLHPHLANAEMIYHAEGSAILAKIYRQYLAIGQEYRVPMLILTPTWRASQENIAQSGLKERDVNGDGLRFLSGLRKEYGTYAKKILIGGLVGSRGDAYKPGEALTSDASFVFHQFQTQALASAGVDFLIASTLPALSEALGIARAMAQTGVAYIISFVVRPTGTLLDATPLAQAISEIDRCTTPRPLCYMANCTHPSVLSQALGHALHSSVMVRERLLGLQANTSTKSPEELDGAVALESEEPEALAQKMVAVHREWGIKILGGCCGTDDGHIRAIAEKMSIL